MNNTQIKDSLCSEDSSAKVGSSQESKLTKAVAKSEGIEFPKHRGIKRRRGKKIEIPSSSFGDSTSSSDSDESGNQIKQKPLCLLCGLFCETRKRLWIHVRMTHNHTLVYECARCRAYIPATGDFAKHFSVAHNEHFQTEFTAKDVSYRFLPRDSKEHPEVAKVVQEKQPCQSGMKNDDDHQTTEAASFDSKVGENGDEVEQKGPAIEEASQGTLTMKANCKNGGETLDYQPTQLISNSFLCHLCPFTCNASSSFNNHMDLHQNDQIGKTTCHICGVVVRTERLKCHISINHPDSLDFQRKEKNLHCLKCPLRTSRPNSSAMDSHNRLHKPDSGAITCSDCNWLIYPNQSKAHNDKYHPEATRKKRYWLIVKRKVEPIPTSLSNIKTHGNLAKPSQNGNSL